MDWPFEVGVLLKGNATSFLFDMSGYMGVLVGHPFPDVRNESAVSWCAMYGVVWVEAEATCQVCAGCFGRLDVGVIPDYLHQLPCRRS